MLPQESGEHFVSFGSVNPKTKGNTGISVANYYDLIFKISAHIPK